MLCCLTEQGPGEGTAANRRWFSARTKDLQTVWSFKCHAEKCADVSYITASSGGRAATFKVLRLSAMCLRGALSLTHTLLEAKDKSLGPAVSPMSLPSTAAEHFYWSGHSKSIQRDVQTCFMAVHVCCTGGRFGCICVSYSHLQSKHSAIKEWFASLHMLQCQAGRSCYTHTSYTSSYTG